MTEIIPFYLVIDKKLIKIFMLSFLKVQSTDTDTGSQGDVALATAATEAQAE